MDVKVIPTIPAKNFFTRNLSPFFNDPFGFISESKKSAGAVFNLNLPLTEVMLVADPKMAQYILQNKNGNYRKGFTYKVLKLSLGNGLVTNDDESWFTNRKLINPFFHKQALENYLAVMVSETEKKIRELKKVRGETDILHHLGDLTLNIVLKSIVKEEDENIVRILREAVNHANAFLTERIANPLSLPLWVPAKANSTFLKIKAKLDEQIYMLIEKRKKNPIDDILSLLVSARDEQGNAMSDQQIRDEVVTLLVAGHETTANALSWTFYLLSKNQDAQDKAIASAQEASDVSTWAGVQKIQYIKQAIQEGMRILPPVWDLNRQAVNEEVVNGYLVPKGREIFISIYAIHHDEEIWPDPEKYDPDRFSPENEKNLDKSWYFPFGLGPRFCIGSNFAMTEMVVVLTLFLKHFRIMPTEHVPELNPLITLTSKNGVVLKLEEH